MVLIIPERCRLCFSHIPRARPLLLIFSSLCPSPAERPLPPAHRQDVKMVHTLLLWRRGPMVPRGYAPPSLDEQASVDCAHSFREIFDTGHLYVIVTVALVALYVGYSRNGLFLRRVEPCRSFFVRVGACAMLLLWPFFRACWVVAEEDYCTLCRHCIRRSRMAEGGGGSYRYIYRPMIYRRWTANLRSPFFGIFLAFSGCSILPSITAMRFFVIAVFC